MKKRKKKEKEKFKLPMSKHATKVYNEHTSTSLHIPNFSTIQRQLVNFTVWLLYYWVNKKRLNGHQSHCGHNSREKHPITPAGN
jgi:hypothetical protein